MNVGIVPDNWLFRSWLWCSWEI